jgi:hypothetical protein
MTQSNGFKKLKVALMPFIILYLLYGVSFLITPGIVRAMAGGNPVEIGWLRWPGAPLIALGIGAIMVYRNPSKQGSFMTTAALTALLIGLALLYTMLFDGYTIHTWFIAVPCAINLGLFVLLVWARQGAKDIL